MVLDNKTIRAIYEHVKRSNHPDPLGFIGRISVESGFDPDKIGKNGELGLNQIHPKRARFFGIDDFESIEGSVQAALDIDNSHLNEPRVKGNVMKMYIAWRQGLGSIGSVKKSTQKWLDKIERAKSEAAKILGIEPPNKTKPSKKDRQIQQENVDVYSGNAFTATDAPTSAINRQILFFFPEESELTEEQLSQELDSQQPSLIGTTTGSILRSPTERLVNMLIDLMDKL